MLKGHTSDFVMKQFSFDLVVAALKLTLDHISLKPNANENGPFAVST